jgi:hypothetical protein
MVENINLQKILFSAPSSVKINALEQKHGNMQNRSFKKHFEDEENEKKKEEERLQPDHNLSYDIQQKGKEAGEDNEQSFAMEYSKNEHRQLKLVDIVV